MNHVYRLVWSHLRNSWVAVAETARGRGKLKGSIAIISTAAAVLAVPSQAHANDADVVYPPSQYSNNSIDQSVNNTIDVWSDAGDGGLPIIVLTGKGSNINGTGISGILNSNGPLPTTFPLLNGGTFTANGVVNYISQGATPSSPKSISDQYDAGTVTLNDTATITANNVLGSSAGPGGIVAASLGAPGWSSQNSLPSGSYTNAAFVGTWGSTVNVNLQDSGSIVINGVASGSDTAVLKPTLTGINASSIGGNGTADSYPGGGLQHPPVYFYDNGGGSGTIQVTTASGTLIQLTQEQASNGLGTNAVGISALAQGGATGVFNSLNTDPTYSLAGTGGVAGTVNVTHGGSIIVNAESGIGILAQSIGGAGTTSDLPMKDPSVGHPADGGTINIQMQGSGSIQMPEGGIGILALSEAGLWFPDVNGKSTGALPSGGQVTVNVDSGASINTGGGGNGSANPFSIGILAVSSGNPLVIGKHNTTSGSGVAGNITITNGGSVTTDGELAIGIAALGIGGVSTVGSVTQDLNYLGSTGVSTGGSGSGLLTVTNQGSITTLGSSADGIVVINSGGGGIIKNDAPTVLSSDGKSWVGGTAIGGNTNSGSPTTNGGQVAVNNSGTITTGNGLGGGIASIGIVAQSIGGSGGTAGGDSTFFNVGDKGGGGGSGGEVDVKMLSGSMLTTMDKNSDGVLVQSIGGGGGNGANISGGFTAVGGAGGAGGIGETATLVADGGSTIRTLGDYSVGVSVQSIGGGGGNGGFADSAGAFISHAIGGSGGNGGDGGSASVTNNAGASMETQGNDSAAMIVQSIGGGGGIGGAASSYSAGVGYSLSMAIGGTGGKGGAGEQANGSNSGRITTGLPPGSLDNSTFVSNTGSLYGTLSDGRTVSSAPFTNGSLADGVLTGTLNNVILTDPAGNQTTIQNATVSEAAAASGKTITIRDTVSGATYILQDGGILDALTANTASNALVNGVFVNGKLQPDPNGPHPNGADSDGMIVQSIGGGGGDGGAAIAKSLALPVSVRGSGVTATTIALAIAIGGNGGAGGGGGTATANNTGSIKTYGDGSFGMLIQSIGGGGGNGGDATASTKAAQYSGIALQLAVGNAGSGAEAGDGGIATANNGASGGGSGAGSVGNIVTFGQDAAGMMAQSIGGGGGTGGVGEGSVSTPSFRTTSKAYSLGIAIGGSGGTASPGGKVFANNYAGSTITTTGSSSQGIIAQSIGGGGGDGGGGSATGSGTKIQITVGVGGNGSAGSNGDTVTVENDGVITTLGGDSDGILAQSTGGGGGAGGSSDAAASAPSTTDPSGFIQTVEDKAKSLIHNYIIGASTDYEGEVSLGGDGGGGGNGGEIDVTNKGGTTTGSGHAENWSAGIATEGERAYGILAQSVGGGGGWGGEATATSRSALAFDVDRDGDAKSYAASIKLGGSVGTPGIGLAVNASNDGVIATHGYGADGIVTQSIGGGGGGGADGSIDSDVTMALGNDGSCTVVASGKACSVGSISLTGGAVTVNNNSTGGIVTTGRDASAIVAQSIGGGGGLASSGSDVFDTIGGGAAGAANHTLTLGEDATTGTLVSQGGTVTVNQSGQIITTGDWSNGIVAQNIGGGGGIASIYSTASVNANLAMMVGGHMGDTSSPQNYTNADSGETDINLPDTGSSITTGSQTTLNGVTTRTGYSAYGILAQSIAGGGGEAADDSGSGTTATGSIQVGRGELLGGVGGFIQWVTGTNNAGTVKVTGNTAVTTYGDAAHAIVLQSIGSGGGVGGQGSSQGADDLPATHAVDVTVGAQGAPGDGGTVSIAGSVLVLNTYGANAYGILAQSIGGGGGLGFAQNASDVSIGGSNNYLYDSIDNGQINPTGDRSNSNTVSLTLDAGSQVITRGDGATAIIAQSIGGGGGVAGYASGAVPFTVSTTQSGSSGGVAGAVTLSVAADIQTSGADADGILAQSIGGGGGLVSDGSSIFAGQLGSNSTAVGSTVNITQQSGSIITTGANSTGIFAQTSGTASTGAVTIAIGGTVEGGSGADGYGIWVDSGTSGNSLTVNSGALLTSLSSIAINYTGGATLNVQNYGSVAGTMQGGGTLTNNSGGTYYVNGTDVNALPANVINNGGMLGLSPAYRGGPDSLTTPIADQDDAKTPVLYQVDTGSTFSILTAGNSYTGGTILAGGTVIINNDTPFSTGPVRVTDPVAQIETTGATPLTLAYGITLDQRLILSTGTAGPGLTMTGVLSGAGGLAISGQGTVTLDTTETYTGPTEVLSGRLKLGVSTALASSAAITVDKTGVLDLNKFDHTFLFLAGSGTISSSNEGSTSKPHITIGSNQTAYTNQFDGTIDSSIGGVTIDNGTLILTGASAYAGGTIMEGSDPTLLVGNDQAIGSGKLLLSAAHDTLSTWGSVPIALANELRLGGTEQSPTSLTISTGSFNTPAGTSFAPDLTLSGLITGWGNLYKTGNGALTLAGNNQPGAGDAGYIGGTYIQGGTLKAGSTTGLNAGSAFTISPGATLDLNGYDSTIGSLAGDGTVTNSAGNVVTLTTGADNSSTVYSGVIVPDGDLGLNKIGSGTLVLDNANTYGGGTRLAQGTLGVANPAALGVGDVTNTGGLLTTAFGNRVINIGGNFVQQSGGTLGLNINDLVSAFDTVHVAGATTLDGTLRLQLDGRFAPGAGTGISALQFSGGVSGQFADVSTSLPTVLASVQGSALTISQGPFANLANADFTANERAVAEHIDAHDKGPMRASFANVIAELNNLSVNPGAVANAFSSISPDKFANFVQTTIVNNATFLTRQFDDYVQDRRSADGSFTGSHGGIDVSRLNMVDSAMMPAGVVQTSPLWTERNPVPSGGESAAPGGADPWHVYVQGNVVLAKDSPGERLPNTNVTTEMVQIGADYLINPHLLAGAMLGYGHSDTFLDSEGSHATLDSYAPGVYASYANGGWYGNALGSYGFNKMRENRRITFGGFNATASGSPSGDQQIANVDGGYDFHLKNWTFGPTGGLQYTHFDVNGYSESGAPGTDLSVHGQHDNSLRSRLGGRVAYAFQHGQTAINTHLDVSWQHEYMNQHEAITSQFVDIGADSFTVHTPNAGRDSAVIDVGIDAKVNKKSTIFLHYATQAGQGNYLGQAIEAGVRVAF